MARRDIEAKGLSNIKDTALFTGFVEFKIKHDAQRDEIIRQLVEKGMGQQEANDLVDKISSRLEVLDAAGRVTFLSAAGAFLVGLAGAAIGIIVWMVVDELTSKQTGYSAIAVGLIAGFGALLGAGGRRGIVIQMLAAAAFLAGISIAEIITHGWICEFAITEIRGLGMLSRCVSTSLVVEGLNRDVTWIGLGLVASLWMTKRKRTATG